MVWAMAVDLTAGLMIFWALSGIVMWWQLKLTRNQGLLVVILGIGISIAMRWSMFEIIYG